MHSARGNSICISKGKELHTDLLGYSVQLIPTTIKLCTEAKYGDLKGERLYMAEVVGGLYATWYVDKTGSEFLARLYQTKEETLEEIRITKENLEGEFTL